MRARSRSWSAATPEIFAAVQPHLAHMGEATHCGEVSFGQVVKALNNMVVFMTANALAEAITIGRARRHRREAAVRDHVEGFVRLAPCCAPEG